MLILKVVRGQDIFTLVRGILLRLNMIVMKILQNIRHQKI